MSQSPQAPQAKTTAIKATETVKKVRPMVKAMNQRAHEARAEGKPIAYCFVRSMYSEIIRAMDITPVWTENYAGVCAAKREATRFITRAHSEGYSDNLCTYAMCGVGFDAMRHELGTVPENAPDGGLERPTVMLGAGMDACDPRHKWYQSLQRYMDTPVFTIGVLWPPFDVSLSDPDVARYYVKYLVDEQKSLIRFLEEKTGRKMDWDRLDEVYRLDNEANRLHWETYQLRKAIPSPMPTEDAMSAMVPASFLGGTQDAVDFYKELYKEVKSRVDSKTGVIPDEKYRIIWGGGLPPWHTLSIFNYFESMGAVFAIETAYRPWDIVEVPSSATHPLEKLAWRHLLRVTFRNEKARRNGNASPELELLTELIDGYHVDAVVMHRAFSCRQVHCGLIHLLSLLKQRRNIPSLVWESDIVDARTFNKVDVENKIDTLIETLADKKRNSA